MKLHELKPVDGSKHRAKRVGRGLGSGHGTYSGRGKKGQRSRSGGTKAPYHQGGNLPLVRKLPFVRGVGFTSRNKIDYAPVNVGHLVDFKAGSDVTPIELVEAGLVRTVRLRVVILGHGEVAVPLKVKAHRVSASARTKIEAAGGSIEILPLE